MTGFSRESGPDVAQLSALLAQDLRQMVAADGGPDSRTQRVTLTRWSRKSHARQRLEYRASETWTDICPCKRNALVLHSLSGHLLCLEYGKNWVDSPH